MINLNILIEPIPKARPRVTRSGHTFTPKRTKDYQTQIGWEFKNSFPNHNPYDKLIKMSLIFTFKVPKSYSKQKTQDALESKFTNNKDVDNLAKSVMDALNGLAYTDDKLIVSLTIHKEYGYENNVSIQMEELDGDI